MLVTVVPLPVKMLLVMTASSVSRSTARVLAQNTLLRSSMLESLSTVTASLRRSITTLAIFTMLLPSMSIPVAALLSVKLRNVMLLSLSMATIGCELVAARRIVRAVSRPLTSTLLFSEMFSM